MPQRMGIRRLYPKPLSIGDLKPVTWLRVSHDTFQDIAKTTWSDRDSVIGAWEDQGHPKDTILAADVEQATTAKKPLRKQLGVLFDGSDDYLAQKVYEDETGASWGPANHGLSLVPGNAFLRVQGVDLSPFAGVEGTDTPYMVVLADQAGKVGWAYAGNQEAAEGLGGELLLNPGFEDWTDGDPDDWADTNGDSADETTIVHGGSHSDKFTVTGGQASGLIHQTIVTEVGKLYKASVWLRQGDSNSINFNIVETTGWTQLAVSVLTISATWTQYIIYFTAETTGTRIRIQVNGDGLYAYIDDVSIKEVTDAGTDAVHLVSTRHGSTRNWAGVEGGFDYNDSAYTFEVRKTWAQITSNLTVGAWVKSDTNAAQVILGKYHSGELNSCFVLLTDITTKVVRWRMTPAWSDVVGSVVVINDTWHLVVGVFDDAGNMQYLYVDGALDGSAAKANNPTDSPHALAIAAAPLEGSFFWNGHINDAFLLDYALDAKSIRQLYEDNKERYT